MSEPKRWHLVEARWWCDCGDIERCRTELYVSDVRILIALLHGTKAREHEGLST
jgi:hypothetical protein